MPRRLVVALVSIGALLALSVGAISAFSILKSKPPAAGQANRSSAGPSPTAERAARVEAPGAGGHAGVAQPEVEGSRTALASAPTAGTHAPTPTITLTSTPSPTDTPYATRPPERTGGPVLLPNNHKGTRWVALQAGHWRNDRLPEELSHLVDSTGASAVGVSEVDINLAVAKLAAQRLYERGYSVEVLDATVPPNYTTDLFLAIHADGSPITSMRGFKAVAPWDAPPVSDKFVSILYEEYGRATGLPTDARTSSAMADYYAFNTHKYIHAVNPHVPSALLEMGFVTNPLDRAILVNEQDRVAWGIANAVDRYFRSGAAGNTPTPYPTFTVTPTSTGTPTTTSTATSTATATSTSTFTPLPPETALVATETAAAATPATSTRTPRLPTFTTTPLPTATPLTGTITTDGRWLPPLSPNGRGLPPPGSKSGLVYLGSDHDDPLDGSVLLRIEWRPHVWRQYYDPWLGRSIWIKGEAIPGRQ